MIGALRQFTAICLTACICIMFAGCDRKKPKKSDPTKGSVVGTVVCTDTNKPARFATITLVAIPQKNDQAGGLDGTEQGTTDLDGQFDLEAVPPGRYYAYATLPGYLDPEMSLDFDRVKAIEDDHAQLLEAIRQWNAHLVEVEVRAQRVSNIRLSLERAAEVEGAVTYDDGSPAIGMHFRAYRKGSNGEWTSVGLRLLGDWSLQAVTDSHGHYSIEGLPSGQYKICALLPVNDEDSSTSVCLGNKLRVKDAASVKVGPGEAATGQDIVIPLSGLYTVAGTVSVLADGHPPTRAAVSLLYADDRQPLRSTPADSDGSFSFSFVPQGRYIVQVTGAMDTPQEHPEADPSAEPATQTPRRIYADKQMQFDVQGHVEDIAVQLVPALDSGQPR